MIEAATNLCKDLIRTKGSPPTIGGTVLHRVIGSGGMGVVYRGMHLRLRVPVAVKFLVFENEDDQCISRFIDEASLAAKISNHNVVRVYDVNSEDGFVFIVQEYVNGVTADQRLCEAEFHKQKLSEDFVLELAADTARGLAAIHDANYLHLDIKPANIMISQRDGGCKILDFGLARYFFKSVEKDAAPKLDVDGVCGGTPGYASPEQLQLLTLGPSSDIYSLGISMYELLTARNAFKVGTWEEAQAVQCSQPPPDVRLYRPDVSDATAELINTCVRVDSTRRFNSAMELLSAIAKVKQSRLHELHAVSPLASAAPRMQHCAAHTANEAPPFVVCVDDDALICQSMSDLLTTAGFRVKTYTSGARALAAIHAEPPEVVFLDMELPGISGVDICRQIRASANLAHVPVVFITAETSPNVMRRAISEGATDYLFKPIQIEDVISRVNCLTRISRAHRELAHLQSQFGQFRSRLSTLSGKVLA